VLPSSAAFLACPSRDGVNLSEAIADGPSIRLLFVIGAAAVGLLVGGGIPAAVCAVLAIVGMRLARALRAGPTGCRSPTRRF
jgi:hypothetical protein